MEKKRQPKPKKELKNVPKDLVPLDEQTWIYQSVATAMMRYDYDVTQIRAVVAIIREMQSAIKAVIFNQARAEDQLSIFPNDEFIDKFGEEEIDPKNEIVLTIPLSKFGSDKRRYSTLKTALKQLATIPVEMPVKSLDDEEYEHIGGLCEAYIPKKAYNKYVYLKLKRKTAIRMIDNKGGTFKFLEQVIFETNQKHALRMYFFISAWRRYPATCVRSVKWVRRWLRLENKYPRWDMFYSSVLKKAEDELYRIAVVEGKGDIYFTTKKIYKPGESEVGEPSDLQFIIHRSPAGEAYDETTEFKAQRQALGEFCHTSFGIKGSDLKSILEHVTMDNIDDLNAYLVELDDEEQKRFSEGKIDKLHRHAFTCIMHWLRDRETEEAKVMEEMMGPSKGPETRKETDAKEPELVTVSSDDMLRWAGVLKGMKSVISESDFLTWFDSGALYPVSFEKDVLTLEVPTRSFMEILSKQFGELLTGFIYQEFGMGTQLQYIIKN